MSSENSGQLKSEEQLLQEKRAVKINEVNKLIGPFPDKLAFFCTNSSIERYLIASNWNVKKATKMLKETLKWRLEYKPEKICWDEVASEAETGKIYRTNYFDMHGRSILVMRPGRQNTKSTKGQIRYLVYCMENAILNLPADQEQMVWLIDFNGFNLSNISIKVTKETAHVLQEHYPERLGVAILYNPPKFFEPFWLLAKPFLEPKTVDKVKFVYSDNSNTMKIMEDLFNADELESAFGGRNQACFSLADYAARMREDDRRTAQFWSAGINFVSSPEPPPSEIMASINVANSGSDSDEIAQEELRRRSSPSPSNNLEAKCNGCNVAADANHHHHHREDE